METIVLRVELDRPDAGIIARAAAVLRAGGLVAFPTETVYGLGANALDAAAVARIFAAKGRPPTNPLIVHAADVDAAQELTSAWPEAAARLAARFWPGPLTLVMPRSEQVPDVVTADGPTVAVRVPAHPVALALLRAARVPVAAPSANRSMQLSPTRAEHVLDGLRGRLDMVLDGGPTSGGLESTVVDVTVTPPRVLRPGLVTPSEIEAVLGILERSAGEPKGSGQPVRSPGQMTRHYAPRAVLEVVEGDGWARVAELLDVGERVGWLTFTAAAGRDQVGLVKVVMPTEARGYAARLYDVLHALDAVGVEPVIVAAPPDTEGWLAVRDRLRRAAAPG